MWRPYLKVIAYKAAHALNVLDRFHIVANINKAVDTVRAQEAKQMAEDGYMPLLKHSRWCFLKKPKNLTERQNLKLCDLLKYNLKSVRAYLLKNDFDIFGSITPCPGRIGFLKSGAPKHCVLGLSLSKK